MKIHLPEQVNFIIGKIENAGFGAYAVGGCVRDSILGKTPSDWDITTSAPPLTVKGLFRRTLDTGLKHGTVTVMLKENGYEVTTYRIDGIYSDSRHPESVTFTPELSEDLRRRDFTVNAMAYNERDGLVDLFGGMKDLETGIIRAVGDPRARFGEDALRILRAFRFAAVLNFTVDPDTREAASEMAGTLSAISAERIREELEKLLTSDHPEKLRDLWETGITSVILPEFDRIMDTAQNNPHHAYSVGEHTIKTLENLPRDLFFSQENLPDLPPDAFRLLRLALLFHDMGKPDCRTTDEEGIDHFRGHPAVSAELAESVMKRLKYDNRTIRLVTALIRDHDYKPEPTRKGIRRAVNRIGTEVFSLLFPLRRADILAQSDYYRAEKLSYEAELLKLYHEFLENKECADLKSLAVNGGDLIRELGMKPGKAMGGLLQRLLEMVLEDPSLNEKEVLLARAAELLQNPQENTFGQNGSPG